MALAFALTPLLRPTPLGALVPISDAVIVLVLCLLLLRGPLRTLRDALRELSGATATASVRMQLIASLAEELREHEMTLVDTALFSSGRNLLGLLYVDTDQPLSPLQVDRLRTRLEGACRRLFADVRLELVLTERPPLPE